jgi:murein DD-endopeptidase MepM/ murein hydrolase activator NlpD
MVNSLRQKAWTCVCTKFPERQVYIRSGARVRFFTVSPLMQTVIVGVAALCFGWVVFTSAHTVFKDQILALREEHFRRVQLSYEARLARLQLGFDRVNEELKGAENHFNAVAADLEAKHRVLAALIRRKQALRASLDSRDSALAEADAPPPRPKAAQTARTGGVGGSSEAATPPAASSMPQRTAPPVAATPLPSDAAEPPRGRTRALIGSAMEGFAALFRSALRSEDVEKAPRRRIADIEARLMGLYPAQEGLLHAAEADVAADEIRFVRAIRATGIDPSGLLAKLEGPVANPVPDANSDRAPEFEAGAARTSLSIDRMAKIVTVLRSVPLTAPVRGSAFEQTSGFGDRTDPFSHRQAFHAGLDFSGPWGAAVHVTAPGIVTFAGARGGYGNTIEVDHGYGIRTRYGHLSRILVRVGNTLEKGAVVGKLGSTGRSTGPHVHYEIWYDDAVRNPSRFLRAASYVHEE